MRRAFLLLLFAFLLPGLARAEERYFVNPGGDAYHRAGCKFIVPEAKEMSLKEAAAGRRACRSCTPPRPELAAIAPNATDAAPPPEIPAPIPSPAPASVEVPLPAAPKAILSDIGQEITAVELQITEAKSEIAKYQGGLIKVMIELRIAYLKNSLAMLNQKKYAVEHRVDGKYSLEGRIVPQSQPDQGRLAELTQDIAAQRVQLAAAKEEDARYSGGLIKAMIGTRIATMENTIALLDQKRLAERYGIPYLLPEDVSSSGPQKGAEEAAKVAPVKPYTTPEQSAPCAVSIERFEIKPRAGEHQRKYADLKLHVKNAGEKRVKAWRLGVRFDDAFGSALFTVRLTDGTADLAPGATGDSSFEFEDNQFIKDEPYDKLMSYAVENLTVSIASCDVSFAE